VPAINFVVLKAYNTTMKEKTFLGLPYDFSRPSWERARKRWWNKNDKRIFTPKVFGWGWTINFYQLFRRIGLTAS
jgi:hypothetical protein